MWIYILSLIFSFVLLDVAQTCTTPHGRTSQCIPVTECTDIINEVKTRGIDREINSFLRKSHCGWSRNVPKICCGPLYIDDDNSDVDKDTLEDSILAPVGQCGQDYVSSKRAVDDRIFGGTETAVGEYPWLAILWYRRRGGDFLSHKCGGMLINRRFVLTAAHCIIGKAVESFGNLTMVSLGEHDVDNRSSCFGNKCSLAPQNFTVANTFPYEDYTSDSKVYDIGLIKLSKRAKYNELVQPICLDRSRKWKIGDGVIVAGWGKTLTSLESSVKLKVSLKIADQAKCTDLFRSQHQLALESTQLCIGGTFRTDSCTGDSGGPAMRHNGEAWEAIGVISFGYGCGRDGWPGIYTVIFDYYNWILRTMRTNTIL